eukprot:2323906-Prymnesium_polylepis.1
MEQRPVRLASQGRCCGSRVCTPAYAVVGVRLRARAMNMCFAHDVKRDAALLGPCSKMRAAHDSL